MSRAALKDSTLLMLVQLAGLAATALILRVAGVSIGVTLCVLVGLLLVFAGGIGWYLCCRGRAHSVRVHRPPSLEPGRGAAGLVPAGGTPSAGRSGGPSREADEGAPLEPGVASYAHEPSFDVEGQSGRYRFLRRLGAGGMGHVFLAEETASGVRVVVKIMRDELACMSNLRRRFGREVRALQRSESPFVMKVLDHGVQRPKNTPFIVTNYIDGRDLEQELLLTATLPVGEVVALATQLAAAVDSSHVTGVLHRDIKPANVIVTRPPGADPRFTLIDFGLSKVVDVDDTLTNGTIGTPRYMAPEQALGDPVDGRADIYSLTAVLYRVLVGHDAVTPDDVAACIRALMFRQPTRPGALAAVGEQTEAVLAIGLAKRAEQRFSTAGELAAALQASFRQRLAPAYLKRARALLERQPWGSWAGAEVAAQASVAARSRPTPDSIDQPVNGAVGRGIP